MNLTGTIEFSAEKKYKQILEDFFISVYDEKSLSSHGIDHHRRVWNYSKELLELIFKEHRLISQFASELIIACYLHDIGMSVDPGVKHGYHSRNLCVQFLIENNLWINPSTRMFWKQLKTMTIKITLTCKPGTRLLIILSVADDLDAFGKKGIERYKEIYLARGIQPDRIGPLILKNAKARFGNFEKIFSGYPGLIKKHRSRYLTLQKYFGDS